MPITTTEKTSAVQEINDKLQYLERIKQEILAQMPSDDNILTRILIKKLNKELEKIDRRIQKAQKDLEAKARASDLIEQDVLDKLSQVAKDAANGMTEGAVDKLEEAGKEIVTDKVKDVIDDKVKDKDRAEILKDIVEEVGHGTIEGAVDVLKDGVKDEVGDLVDEHVKNERVAALIKEVVEGVVEGDFEGLLEVVADGVVDIIEDRLIEFVQHLLNLLEEKLYQRIEERLKGEVKELIDEATKLAIDKTGAEWTAKLVATVVRRLLRRSLEIIKEEVKYLTSKKTLETLLGVLKDAAIQTLQSGLRGRKIKDILKELLEHAENHPEFKKIIRDLRKRLAEKFLAMAIEEVKAVAVEVIDAFLRVHGNWRGALLTLKRKKVSIGPFWGCVSIDMSAAATITGALTSRRKGIGAVAHGQVNGNGFVGVGVSIGYELPIVGGVSIAGGIEGGPTIGASLDMELEAKNSTIHASIAPFSINAALAGRFYLETPIPNKILKYIPAYIEDAIVIKQNVYYPLGKIDLLVIKTPKYSMTFNMKKGKYVYEGSSGDYQYYLDPRVKALIKEFKESIEKAADEALAYLDPSNIDLNPFDSEGWIGKYF